MANPRSQIRAFEALGMLVSQTTTNQKNLCALCVSAIAVKDQRLPFHGDEFQTHGLVDFDTMVRRREHARLLIAFEDNDVVAALVADKQVVSRRVDGEATRRLDA